ncbi:MAG: type I methionyl aminopeptidase, partial [Propionibacteriales bacterium]|nr:type I methionyl aminopeptidase [Propionibacteriales bacterium]
MFGARGVEIKKPEQIVAMRRAGLVVQRALAAVADEARAGITTGELDAVANDVIRSAGAIPSFLNY